MDHVNIISQQGKPLKDDVPFVRAPIVGEWVAAGNQWAPVVAVSHRWIDGAPVLTITIDLQRQVKIQADLPLADDYVLVS